MLIMMIRRLQITIYHIRNQTPFFVFDNTFKKNNLFPILSTKQSIFGCRIITYICNCIIFIKKKQVFCSKWQIVPLFNRCFVKKL